MLELTEQQSEEIGESSQPVRIVDPKTKREFFLVGAELFTRLQVVMGDFNSHDSYAATDRTFAEGWNDPAMSDYDSYEQNKREP